MGVLNVTPDSFFDGGRYRDRDAMRGRIEAMAEEGADLIDVGGESTRPGSKSVSVDEELDRVIPAIEMVVRSVDVPVSIDTTRSQVALEAVAAGAEFVNDISGLTFDPAMAAAVASSGAGLFVMHTRGRPATMQQNTDYADVMGEIIACLEEAVDRAEAAGVATDRIAVDPGIGFAKSMSGNLEILRRLDELTILGKPILIGTSRKNFIGRVLGRDEPEDRLAGTLATVALGVAAGADVVRVHDVRPARDAALMARAIAGENADADRGGRT